MLPQRLREDVQVLSQHLALRLAFEVDARHLLLAGHQSQLYGGGQLRIGLQVGADAAGGDQGSQRKPGLVGADHADQPGLRAQVGHVARHVGRTAGAFLGAQHLDHRHRRLGRDAVGVAEPVAVEHHVADNEDAGGGEDRARGQFGLGIGAVRADGPDQGGLSPPRSAAAA